MSSGGNYSAPSGPARFLQRTGDPRFASAHQHERDSPRCEDQTVRSRDLPGITLSVGKPLWSGGRGGIRSNSIPGDDDQSLARCCVASSQHFRDSAANSLVLGPRQRPGNSVRRSCNTERGKCCGTFAFRWISDRDNGAGSDAGFIAATAN